MTPEQQIEKLTNLTFLCSSNTSERIDVRAIEYNLSLSPGERMHRNDLMVSIAEAMHLADSATLVRALDMLSASARRNSYWNSGEAKWRYRGEPEVGSHER